MVLFNLVPTIVDGLFQWQLLYYQRSCEREENIHRRSFKRKIFSGRRKDKRIHEQEISGNIDNTMVTMFDFLEKISTQSFKIIQAI